MNHLPAVLKLHRPGTILLNVPLVIEPLPILAFELKEIRVRPNDAPRYFYECKEPSCPGCGCPLFDNTNGQVPDHVLEHLQMHAALKHSAG